MARFVALLTTLLLLPIPAAAQSASAPTVADLQVALDTVWVLFAAFLVFFMQAGFGMVEAGFIRAKNTCNILTKNFVDFCVASLGFFAFGYAFMFGGGNRIFGDTGWFLVNAKSGANVPLFAFWLFQAAFCGAAATIVAGGVAERMKFRAYLLYTVLLSAFIYPIIGHWVWGGGWLGELGFADFAGSTVVHATGGWAALAGTLMVGPRLGKYNPDGSRNVIAGHNIPIASLGVFILWFGWFGFNPGSTLGVGNGELISLVAINTNLSACAGALAAMIAVWLRYGTPDLSMAMNGALAGLVAITAPCAYVSPASAIAIGAIGGILVAISVDLLDRFQVDDPVGAVAVHGVNGIWGTLAVGVFGQQALGLRSDGLLLGGGFSQLGIQALGAFTSSLCVFVVMLGLFKFIDALVGLRVSREEELKGLDIGEHGMESYSGFQIFVTE